MKRELRAKACELRQQGMSIRDIAERLGVSRGTVSLWVRDIQLTAEQIAILKANQYRYAAQNRGAQVNRQKFRLLRATYQEQGRQKAREMHPLHMAGCMLYWAEGAKDPNGMYFTNSDPHMLSLFVRFLRQELYVDNALITLRIHCHTKDAAEVQRIERYWLDLLALPKTALRKTLYKQGSDKSRRVLHNGICSIRVERVEVVQHIYGAIQEYGGFEQPEWLF